MADPLNAKPRPFGRPGGAAAALRRRFDGAPNPPSHDGYDRVVSLGRHCQAAYQIGRLLGPERPSQFFDWLITPHSGLIALLEQGFDDFLAAGRVETRGISEGRHQVVDTGFGIELLHDFPAQKTIAARIGAVRVKYAHLARRFLSLTSNSTVFIRQVKVAQEDEARAIQTALSLRLGTGTRLMMIADAEPQGRWNVPGVVAVHVRQPEPYDWRGSNEQWDAAFRAVDALLANDPAIPLP